MLILNSRRCVLIALATAILPLQGAPDDRRKDHGDPTVGTLVVVGDSLSAGFENFSLNDTGQVNGFASVVANQANATLALPLFSYPGVPPALVLTASGQIVRAAGIGARENPATQAHNLSVPGFNVADALAHAFPGDPLNNPIDALSDLILAAPGVTPGCGPIPQGGGLVVSEVTCAVALNPQTILVSIGNNDALQALTFGLPPTGLATFTAQYTQLLSTLHGTGAKIVVNNIPDVTAIPFLVPVPAFQTACPNPTPPLPAGVTSADFVVVNITNTTAISLDLCTNYAVRPAALIAQAKQAVSDYNGVIATIANRYGAVVVDINGLLANLEKNGYQVGGQRLTTAFLGGLFSLDGIHPTNTGYAILANEVINTMNRQLHTIIAPISVEQVAKKDPLVF